MIEVNYSDIVNDELMQGALIHDVFTGFKADYLTLHCLLRKYQPKTIWESGTNIGSGINVMATSLPNAKIYSLDLDYETMRQDSLQYPLDGSGNDRVGSAAKFPYTQLRGDGRTFDYSKYPCEAAYLDSEHTTEMVTIETAAMIKNGTRLIVFHDSDMPEVMAGIVAGMSKDYELYRVTGTRISYLLKKQVKDLTAGGIVTGPIVYSEVDSPEQIIPLDKLKALIAKPKKKKK